MALVEEKSVDALLSDFASLTTEFDQFQEQHLQYLKTLDAVENNQNKCLKDLHHHKYRIKQLEASLQALKSSVSPNDAQKFSDLSRSVAWRKQVLADITETLPRKSNIYLRTVIGNVNLSLLSKSERFSYKDEYERFKLKVTILSTIMSFCNLFLVQYRFADAAFHFLLVWYYCTLTIREGILRLNGSKIQPWWVAHHYISGFVTGVMVTWPDTPSYQEFRNQFYCFSLYLGLVQILQYRYQHGQLYKLKALGERRNSMDLTVEGFHSWMWKGLGFLLPFLFGGYLFQLYNSYTLWRLSKDPRCHEWQVAVCAFTFFVLFSGNVLTTLLVVKSKMQRAYGAAKEQEQLELQAKYLESDHVKNQ